MGDTNIFVVVFFCLFSCTLGVVMNPDLSVQYVKECYGTNMWFSCSGGPDFHYESLKRRYGGCTYVQGNLEITNLNSANITYDLQFLSSIEVVTGYVLLGLLHVDIIPLTNLRLIRADNTMKIKNKEYGLVVVVTAESHDAKTGLKQLQLPALREISRGKVLFSQNPLLCFVDTIAWNAIVLDEEDPVDFYKDGYRKDCEKCLPDCEVDGRVACWGPEERLCQRDRSLHCHSVCPGQCLESGLTGCCHPECAIGCSGPFNYECMMCKYFRYDFHCVSECPENTYPLGQECINF